MKNKSFVIIVFGLLLVMAISVMIHFDMSSPILHIFLAIGFVLVGVGIILGFINMVTEDKN